MNTENHSQPLQSISSTPTQEETALRSAGQRTINLLWETMQAFLAAAVVGMTLYVSSRLILVAVVADATEKQLSIANTAFMLLSNLASLIIGFYFGRTNHQRTGGVGQNDSGR